MGRGKEVTAEPPWWLWAIGAVCMTALLIASFFAPNAGESLVLEISTTSEKYEEWVRVTRIHEFTRGRLDTGGRISLTRLLDEDHAQLDTDIARARLASSEVPRG